MKRYSLVLMMLFSLPVFAGDAPMFRGGPEHLGIFKSPALEKFTKIKWKFHTGGRVISSPTVAGDTLYVGSGDHNFYAVNLADGKAKWKFETGSRIASSAAVSGGLAYFESYDGSFYAIDTATGKPRWTFPVPGERRYAATHLHGAMPEGETMPDPFDFYLSSPVVWNGSVYFGSGNGNIYALDAAKGDLKWKFQAGDVVHASPAIADGTVFVGSWDSYFYALDAATGKEKWRFKTGEDPKIHNQVGIQSSAAVADGTVYFGCRDSNFYAVDEATGKQKWAFNNKGSWVIASPAVRDGKVYFATSDTGMFYALDAKTGAQMFSLNYQHWPMFSSPALAGQMAYIGSNEGKLMAIDLNTQKTAWTFQTDGSRQNGATYTKPDGSPNYEGAYSDFFYDDMMEGGGKMLSVGTVLSSPAVVDGVVYFGSTDGNLYAIE